MIERLVDKISRGVHVQKNKSHEERYEFRHIIYGQIDQKTDNRMHTVKNRIGFLIPLSHIK